MPPLFKYFMMLIQPFKIDMLQYAINLEAAYQQVLSNYS